MSEKERIDACLRIVSNRCRNLRKAIDRAKGLEEAVSIGQNLRDEQLEVIKAIPKKEALLAELEEVLRKQTMVMEPKEQTPKQRKRPEKSVEKSNGAHSEPSEHLKSASPSMSNSSDTPTQLQNEIDVAALEDKYVDENKRLQEENERLIKAMSDLSVEHNESIVQEKREVVRKVLNLSHVADFLREQGSRSVLLKFFQSPELNSTGSSLSELDMDLLCYFNMMLTSPNGNVPHNSAVDVSTAHCLEYLSTSSSDAFKGTSYARLSEIVETIATCPVLTGRGVAKANESVSTENGTSKGVEKKDGSGASKHDEPGLIVSDITSGTRL